MNPKFAEPGDRTFEIIKADGKAPYKVLFMRAGVEERRTHHKTLALAFGKCATFNPNMPVTNKTGE